MKNDIFTEEELEDTAPEVKEKSRKEAISDEINDFYSLISALTRIREDKEDESEQVKSKALIGRLAFFYEKMRNTLEYKDEHLIFKSGLERILRRKFPSYLPGKELGEEIVNDLIIGGYVENGSITANQVKKIDSLLERYHKLLTLLPARNKKNIIFHITCAIECVVNKKVLEKEALVEFSVKTIEGNYQSDIQMDPGDFRRELFVAVHKILVKSDYQTIRYWLLREMVPDLENFSVPVENIFSVILDADDKITNYFKSPRKNNFLRFVRKNIPPYSLLGKIIARSEGKNIEEIVRDKESLAHNAELSYSNWRENTYSKISTAAVKSVIFIFFTKMILAFVVEIPYDIIFLGHISWMTLGINLVFPPFYMFISSAFITVPGRENLRAIKDDLEKIVFSPKKLLYQIRLKEGSSIKKILFSLIYLITFAISFGGLIWLLNFLGFSIVAGVLFFVFFSTVNFFSYRISQRARDLTMVKEKVKITDIIVDFFSVPFIRLGQIFSSSFSRFNVFLFIFDFIIETPFKTIVGFLDDWFKYAQEKKEDILNK